MRERGAAEPSWALLWGWSPQAEELRSRQLALGQLREGSVASSSARDPSLGLGALWRDSKADSAEVPLPFSVLARTGKVLEVSSCHEAGGP